MRRLSSAFIPPGPNRHADTRVDSRTSRQTCSTGVRDSNSPELVVVATLQRQQIQQVPGDGKHDWMQTGLRIFNQQQRSRVAIEAHRPFACRRVANSPSRITRWLRPPGLSIIRLIISR